MANNTKTVIVDFTDETSKPYLGVPETILNDPVAAGKTIVARAKKDYPKKEVQTWNIEEEQAFIAPAVDQEISDTQDFPGAFILSKNGKRVFLLRDLLKGAGLIAQVGLTEKELVQNMRNLAINVLDPIKKKYPNMQISSGFRKKGSNKHSVENSDHDLGGAADLVFANLTFSDYVDVATWISKNVQHKQLLLEYVTDASGNIIKTWIHIAYLLDQGGRLKKSNTPIATLVNHGPKQGGTIQAGLINIAAQA